VVIVAALGAFGGAAWYFSSELKDQALTPSHDAPEYTLTVITIDEDRVTLRAGRATNLSGEWQRQGTYGLEWDGGYAQIYEVLERGDRTVTRRMKILEGELTVGAQARVDPFAYPGDPMRAFGLRFDEVFVEGRQGRLPAWLVPAEGESSAWAILVHGRNASRQEMLRDIPAFHRLGVTVLVITYRNDEGAPRDEHGRLEFGATEWQDLQSAVEYAVERGAEQLLLGGNSMGGAIVMSFLYRSPDALKVSGVLLDAPMLDFEATVEYQAPGALPGVIVDAGEWFASRRFGIDWGELDYLRGAAQLDVPILLFHGLDDEEVPVATSERLAALRPDLVTYMRVAGAGHVRSWNLDPETYEGVIEAFFGQLLGPDR
jgi:alpha-beta hydrolase superfamily lysophospholipase